MTSQDSRGAVGGPPARPSPDAGRRAARSGAIGSLLEFYDFFIYTHAAALAFPLVFFPASDPTLGILASLGTFGVGYLARPVGAFVLGAMADRVGRRFTLILTLGLMSGATFALGLLPGYAQIGIAAPILLVTFRLMQGFAVAGEISGASTQITEQTNIGMRGRRASVTLQGAQIGQIVAAFIFIPLAAFLPQADFVAWGWRIPFLLSGAFTLVGFRIRLATEESKPESAPGIPPVRRVFRDSSGLVIRVFFMSLANIIPVTATVFGAALATQKPYGIGWPDAVYLWIPVLGNVVSVAMIPWAATLSDRFGRRPLIIGGALGSGLLSFVYLWAITQSNMWLALTVGLLMWGTLYQGYNAVFPSYYPELFPAATRVTGMAIGQNAGTAVSSLLAMVFVALCPPGTPYGSIVLIVGGITFGVTILVAIAAASSPETYRIPDDQLGQRDATALPSEEYLEIRARNLEEAKTGRTPTTAPLG